MRSIFPLIGHLADLMVGPAKLVYRQDERRQARLVSTILLILVILIMPAILIFRQESIYASNIFIAAETFYIAAYGISRTHRYRIAAGMTVALLAVTPMLLAFYGGQYAVDEIESILFSNCIALLVCSLIFPLPALLTTTILNLLAICWIVIARGLNFLSMSTPISLDVIFSVLIILAARFRDRLEEDRLAALSAANHELELMRSRLEERVAERTQELRQAYDTVQAEHERLLKSERMASLGRLTAGIAHEINTPLAASRAALVEIGKLADEYLDSIGDEQVTPEDHREIGQEMLQSLKLAEDGTQRIAGFVRGIKAQIHDVAPGEKVSFNAVPVIRESLLLVNHALRAAHCDTQFDSPADYVELFGLPGQLSQIVTNLVTNAIDASAGKDVCQITLKLVPHAGGVDLLVSDQGEGIPEEIRPKIFDLLFTTKPTGHGTGLGLTIVRDIMNNIFDGSIDFVSQVGQGTTFTLHFPQSGGTSGT